MILSCLLSGGFYLFIESWASSWLIPNKKAICYALVACASWSSRLSFVIRESLLSTHCCQVEDTAKKNNASIFSRATEFAPMLGNLELTNVQSNLQNRSVVQLWAPEMLILGPVVLILFEPHIWSQRVLLSP